jgi:indolepyruvate ferredoxin oxidoreductase
MNIPSPIAGKTATHAAVPREGGTAALSAPTDLERRYIPGERRVLLSGVQAVARLLVEQHERDRAAGLDTGTFVSGYQGSPLGGLDRTLASIPTLPSYNIRLVPGVNEELAATSVWGSQMELPGRTMDRDGVVGVWYGKAPGLDRAGDAIRHGSFMGAHPNGGVLVLVGDDPGCKSSTLPSASEATLAALGLPVLYPRNSEEIISFGLAGIVLSRAAGCWVGIKIVADVADGTWLVDTDFSAMSVTIPQLEWAEQPWVYRQHTMAVSPHSLAAEVDLQGPRAAMVEAFVTANPLSRIELTSSDAHLGIVAAGKTYDDARQALQDLGLDDDAIASSGLRLLRLGVIHPLDRRLVREFASGLRQILVVEEKGTFIEAGLREALYGVADPPVIIGKRDQSGESLIPASGELTATDLEEPLRRVLPDWVVLAPHRTRKRLPALTVQRTPYFCSGCPHNRSTPVPEGSLLGAGIGCHGMVTRMPRTRDQVTGITQMGGEGAQWIGQSAFNDTGHIFQNIGDGTYFHSGQLAVQAAVAAGVNITYKILYNSAVAMTGGQDAQGALSVPALTRKLHAEGVKDIIVCTEEPRRYRRRGTLAPGTKLWHRDRLDEAQRALRELPGVTVLIYDQQCAAEARRLRKRGQQPARTERLAINEAVCEGCGDCGAKSNCLSLQPVSTELGRKTRIDQTSCNTDYSCLLGDCPSFVTIDVGQQRGLPSDPTAPPDLTGNDPTRVADIGNIVAVGIGGTGVVTVNQVLAAAAQYDGIVAHGLDQTGLSQKAGPVTSHLRLGATPGEPASRVGAGQADCYIACDLLVAAEERNLLCASPRRTIAAISVSITPTGDMVADPDVAYPDRHALLERIRARCLRTVEVDAVGIAIAVFGHATPANFILVGAAYQSGALPLKADAIEDAIRLNGVAVDTNITAFRWGRAAVADPSTVETIRQGSNPAKPLPTDLADHHLWGEPARAVEFRLRELIDYQGPKLARDYLKRVHAVWDLERTVTDRTEFSTAVARSLYHLTAYKDEYEVARLLTSPGFEADIRKQFPGTARVRYNLHPPLLRSLGVKRKIRLGPTWRPVLRLLARGRRLRGTAFDPFGHTSMRRSERMLIQEYHQILDHLLKTLSVETYDNAVAIAASPETVRGYESVKRANIGKYHSQLRELGVAAEFICDDGDLDRIHLSSASQAR